MPRLFTGIELPDEIRDRLRRLKVPLPGAKWVEPINMHLTLRFAGDIDNVAASEFADALSQINTPCFEMTILGVGAFGGHEPHTLYAAVAPNTELDALARANERAARNAGLAAQSRAFKPHVTLARLRHGDPHVIARFLGRNGGLRIAPIFVDRFALFSSRPKTGGGPYVIEEEFALGAPAAQFDWAAHRGGQG